MRSLRYIEGVVTIGIDSERCIGCGVCSQVCPHGVLAMEKRKARIVDRNGCMECGACANNCPVEALSVSPGVGCAALIIKRWLKGKSFIGAPGCC